VRIVVVTGLSGAGKSTALRALEDLDYFCVDNLPLPLVERFVDLLQEQGEVTKAALVVDAREGEFLSAYRPAFAALRERGHPVEVLFLDAPDDALLRRFSETRRRHPLAGDDLRAGITRERQMLAALREDAGAIVDTGNLNVHQLKGIIQERYGRTSGLLSVTLLSFGFKHGYPAEADVVLDVRFLPNPYFVESLSGSTGLDPVVARYVLENDDAREFLQKGEELLAFMLPRFEREGKAYLTIAVGCTGGRHRSVAVTEELARRLKSKWTLTLRHRDLERGRQT
jgi:RNase adapter protein RapZ